ncbi:hypothetical protein GCK72_026006 [Caenorhabditis remanei]|uniref:Uncharacterized protein n=2 Tax=Caenorhabditis remanei TaxID=31234 RepID=E3NEX9_CAERE|nr:hypothetical protein GCK72_026006 [Caenorhabditis remanei]EFO95857.1 hypothetical protein CRE_14314 [Caenorhabditis remanei]KAF1749538.1 hypothetical protein GCK72_026006 [Caenorhabditis remanei]
MKASKLLTVLFVFCNVALPVYSLSCYRVSSIENGIVENKSMCTAYYETVSGEAAFGGANVTPAFRQKAKFNFDLEEDCQLQRVKLIDGSGYTGIWACFCATPMCNYPFSYAEFASRGHTLRPVPLPIESQ